MLLPETQPHENDRKAQQIGPEALPKSACTRGSQRRGKTQGQTAREGCERANDRGDRGGCTRSLFHTLEYSPESSLRWESPTSNSAGPSLVRRGGLTRVRCWDSRNRRWRPSSGRGPSFAMFTRDGDPHRTDPSTGKMRRSQDDHAHRMVAFIQCSSISLGRSASSSISDSLPSVRSLQR